MDKSLVTTGSPVAVMELALNKDMDIDKLTKILDLQERWEKNEAKKAYTQAMADFKKTPLKIIKDKHVSFQTSKGKTQYDHASLGNVTATINSALAEHGLSASWKTEQEKGITVTCTITHKLGYSESNTLSSTADTTGTKNNIQALGSTITYLQRYTLLALTGLATHDQDDDGKTSEVKYITKKQVSEITDMINSTESDEAVLLKWAKAESIEQIPASFYGKIISSLKAKVKK